MHDLIPAMSDQAIGIVRCLERAATEFPQVHIETTHAFHAGLYARTVKIPAGVIITGALIKIPTLLIISGEVVMYLDGSPKKLHGYNVFAASAHRKQAFVAITDTHLTMLFPTTATTVEEAEAEFTDEVSLLMTNRELECQV